MSDKLVDKKVLLLPGIKSSCLPASAGEEALLDPLPVAGDGKSRPSKSSAFFLYIKTSPGGLVLSFLPFESLVPGYLLQGVEGAFWAAVIPPVDSPSVLIKHQDGNPVAAGQFHPQAALHLAVEGYRYRLFPIPCVDHLADGVDSLCRKAVFLCQVLEFLVELFVCLCHGVYPPRDVCFPFRYYIYHSKGT